jgi:hypothetical protein
VATPAKKQFDESLINFYDEQLVAHADTVFRFAFALTLSLDGAMRCVKHTFHQLASHLDRIAGGSEANAAFVLVAEAWKAYHDLKNQKFQEGQSAVTKALKPLSLESRAALVAVDVAGLAAPEAARALGWEEKELRMHLAAARRTLMSGALEL